MADVNKLELTWVGKDKPINVEPRILIEKKELGNTTNDANTENMLIHGDNLLALKALENKYAGNVKCIYIDPPYNTGNAFEHYDDGLEHSIWLSLMRERLVILRNLLADDGSIWISLDDTEQAYCKVLCDEIFGRINFVANVIWEKKFAPQNDAKWLSDNHDFVIVYAKNKNIWRPNLLPRSETADSRYKNLDNDPRGVWTASDMTVRTYVESCDYPITTPSGKIIFPTDGRCWMTNKDNFEKLVADNRIWFGKDGNNVPRIKKFLSEVKQGMTSTTIWKCDEVGHNQDAKKEVKEINSTDVFSTPKPERLIERVLTLASNEGDLVLDSFLGSGTTAAVAQKMERRYIGIEMGNHAYTHCKVRLDKVIEGEQGGISKSVNWQGGGAYRFYELAPTLIKEDAFGQAIINPEYNAEMLANAVSIHEGYTYNPQEDCYWKQASNDSNSYLFVTTRHINKEYIDTIISEMKEDEFLLIVCKSYDASVVHESKKIAIKKIPQSLLKNCEFDVNDYNLNIICPPTYEEEYDED